MKIERDDSSGWIITEYTEKDEAGLIADISNTYKDERKNMDSDEDFIAKVLETANSILTNQLQEAYIDIFSDDEVLVLVPENGFGSMELYFRSVEV